MKISGEKKFILSFKIIQTILEFLVRKYMIWKPSAFWRNSKSFWIWKDMCIALIKSFKMAQTRCFYLYLLGSYDFLKIWFLLASLKETDIFCPKYISKHCYKFCEQLYFMIWICYLKFCGQILSQLLTACF